MLSNFIYHAFCLNKIHVHWLRYIIDIQTITFHFPEIYDLIERHNSTNEHSLMSRRPTWRRVTSPDDFKMCVAIKPSTSMTLEMHVATWRVVIPKPVDSNTITAERNASSKTLLLCFCCGSRAIGSVHVMIDNPARWTVDSWPWCRCGIDRWYCASVIWVTYKQTCTTMFFFINGVYCTVVVKWILIFTYIDH